MHGAMVARRRNRNGPPEDETPEAARERAHGIALRLLAHRSRSISEMRRRLAERDLPETIVEAEIERLVEVGLLDDARFAGEKAAALLRRGLGPKSARSRLAASGVGAEAAGALDQAVADAGGEEALAKEIVARRFGDLSDADRETRSKAARFLVRRGFSGSVAGAVCGIFQDG
jgi:regulatory protein